MLKLLLKPSFLRLLFHVKNVPFSATLLSKHSNGLAPGDRETDRPTGAHSGNEKFCRHYVSSCQVRQATQVPRPHGRFHKHTPPARGVTVTPPVAAAPGARPGAAGAGGRPAVPTRTGTRTYLSLLAILLNSRTVMAFFWMLYCVKRPDCPVTTCWMGAGMTSSSMSS